jgi:hypothetical protein
MLKIDLSKLKTRVSTSKSDELPTKQAEPPAGKQRQPRHKKTTKHATSDEPVLDKTGETGYTGIKAQTKLSSMMSKPKQPAREVYVRIIEGMIALILIIDSALGKEKVGTTDGVIYLHNRQEALGSERAKNTKSSEIQAYGALTEQAKLVVDRILTAFDSGERVADITDLAIEPDVKTQPTVTFDLPPNRPEPMVNGDDDDSSESSDSPSDKVETLDPAPEDEDEYNYDYDDTPLPNFPIYRRGGASLDFYEVFLLSHVRNMLASWDNEEGAKIVVVVREDEHLDDYDTFCDDVLVWSLDQWRVRNLADVHFLTNIQSILDIALFDRHLTRQWYVGMTAEKRLMFWS